MSLRTAIVGCGAVAQRLYRTPLRQLEKRGLLRITALVDPIPDHAGSLGASFPKAARYQDLGDALSASAPELTLILSPAHLHCSHALQAMRHGSHVLCEKPMASTAEECGRMNAVAAERNRVLAVGMVRRFFPAYARLRQMLEDGHLGSLVSFEYREGHKFEWEVTTPAAFRPRSQGGTGVLFDIGPHAVDHLAWTFGDLKPLTYSDDALAGIEANVSLDVESPSCRGAIHLSWNSPQANELRVVGQKGEAVLRIGYFDQLAVRRASGFEPLRADVSFAGDVLQQAHRRVVPRSYSDAIYCQVVQVLRAIEHGEPPAVDGRTAGRSVSLLESALTMARPLDVPWLELAHQESFQQLHWRRQA
jgi:predicted dehydrogenase